MSSEQSYQTKRFNSQQILYQEKQPIIKTTSKVNINDLFFKLKEREIKKKKENVVFLGLLVSVLIVSGVIASLS
jgi:hypothetical protein